MPHSRTPHSGLARGRRFILFALAGALTIALTGATAVAQIFGIPSLPDPSEVISGAVSQQIVRKLGKTIADEAPVTSSSAAVYPTVAVLPGRAFTPASTASLQRRSDGSVLLPPGDYQFAVATFCMDATTHSPNGNTFTLAPLRGKLADVITAVHARATAGAEPHGDVQTLSWQLQAGLKYDELGARSQALVNRYIPEFRPRLNESYMEKIERTWSTLASAVPGTPSLDDALDSLGDAGRTIRQLKLEREELLASADDFTALGRVFAQPADPRPVTNGSAPWSMIGQSTYARMLNEGSYTGPGVYQVRVASPARAFALLPVASQVGVPNGAVQPLAIAPDPAGAATPAPGASTPPGPPQTPACKALPYGAGVDGVPGATTDHSYNSENHPGIDVDAQRGTPVYLDLEPKVAPSVVSAPFYHSTSDYAIPETGELSLVDATVTPYPFPGSGTDDWGGVIRVTARYRGASGAVYSIDIDYLHLITPDRMPRDDLGRWIDRDGKPILNPAKYRGCVGFGADMRAGMRLSRAEIEKHPLVGFLGATQSPHVHIQASYKKLYFNPQPFLNSQAPSAPGS